MDHPEISPTAQTYTVLARYGSAPWRLTDFAWEISCGKDEGPLVWATVRILETGRLDAPGGTPPAVYTSPLPPSYLDLLAQLGGWKWHHAYLPIITTR